MDASCGVRDVTPKPLAAGLISGGATSEPGRAPEPEDPIHGYYTPFAGGCQGDPGTVGVDSYPSTGSARRHQMLDQDVLA
jgi:hypothetical protein